MKTRTLLAFAFASFVALPVQARMSNEICSGFDKAAKLPPEQDAVRAAPKNHRVIFENDDMRVLEVTVLPGEQENLHHHRWPSVFVVDALPKFDLWQRRKSNQASSAGGRGSGTPPHHARTPSGSIALDT